MIIRTAGKVLVAVLIIGIIVVIVGKGGCEQRHVLRHPRVVHNLLHGGPLARVGLEEPPQEVPSVIGCVRRHGECTLDDPLADLGPRSRSEGHIGGEEREQECAQAPHVGLGTGVRRVIDDLGRGVVERPDVRLDGALGGPRGGQSKVAEERVPSSVEQHVLRFDVPVDDPRP